MKALIGFILLVLVSAKLDKEYDEQHGVLYPNTCEVCKYLAIELESRLQETGKTREVLDLSYELESKKKTKKKYRDSELRLLESLEGICEKMLDYNVHKERKDSSRIDKDMSQTFKTLHGLVEKGVKVDLGIPYELWDKPSAEITSLKAKCEHLLEEYEDDIEDWYYNYQTIPLKSFLCTQRVLQKGDDGCLDEVPSEEKDKDEKPPSEEKDKDEKPPKKKKQKKSKTEL